MPNNQIPPWFIAVCRVFSVSLSQLGNTAVVICEDRAFFLHDVPTEMAEWMQRVGEANETLAVKLNGLRLKLHGVEIPYFRVCPAIRDGECLIVAYPGYTAMKPWPKPSA